MEENERGRRTELIKMRGKDETVVIEGKNRSVRGAAKGKRGVRGRGENVRKGKDVRGKRKG